MGSLLPPDSSALSLGPDAFGEVHSALTSSPIPIPAPVSLPSLPFAAAPPWLALLLPLVLPLISTRPELIPPLTANVRSWLVTATSDGFRVVVSRPPRGVLYCTELGLMMSGYPSPFISSKSTSPKLGATPKDAPSGPMPNASAALGAVRPMRVTALPAPPVVAPSATESEPRRDDRAPVAVALRLSR